MNNIDKAYDFYKQHIFDPKKIELLKEHNLKVAGHIHSVIWELFCALITGEKAEGITGADLKGWEVKSAKGTGNFEYQYHRNAHLDKLEEDRVVNHIFCSYSDEYDGVIVRVMRGSMLCDKYFDTWKPLCIEKYKNPDNLRFRKSVSSSYVKNNGLIVLEINKGKLVFKDDGFKVKLNNL
jgi:hypothetical protein